MVAVPASGRRRRPEVERNGVKLPPLPAHRAGLTPPLISLFSMNFFGLEKTENARDAQTQHHRRAFGGRFGRRALCCSSPPGASRRRNRCCRAGSYPAMRIIASSDAASHAVLRAGRLARAKPALSGLILPGYADDPALKPLLVAVTVGGRRRRPAVERNGVKLRKAIETCWPRRGRIPLHARTEAAA